MKPFDLVNAPAELVSALRVLPTMAERLDEIAKNTAELPRVAEATTVLPQMDGRMETIENTMPALLEVQQQLTDLPEILGRLSTLMERLLSSMDRLDEQIDTLHGSIQPLGRLADRVPGGNRD